MSRSPRTPVRGEGWTRKTSIESNKFELIAGAILESLTAEPIMFTRLVQLVAGKLPDFDGSVSWYSIVCLRELEVRGEVVRQHRPVRYLKPVQTGAG